MTICDFWQVIEVVGIVAVIGAWGYYDWYLFARKGVSRWKRVKTVTYFGAVLALFAWVAARVTC